MDTYIDLQPVYEVVKVSGADAVTFLQGQLTCDISELDNQVIWGAYCNIKGRVVALFRLFKHHQCCFLIVSQGLANKLIKTLQRYIFRAKVNVVRADYYCYGLLQCPRTDCPEGQYMPQHEDYYLALPHQRGLFLTPQQLADAYDNSNAWQQAAIALNEPQLYPQTCALFLPDELGLDALGAVSLNKGCYVGQEIIARMHYLGKAKKTMRQITHQIKAEPGATLYHDAQAVGHIITSAATDDGFVSLANLKKDITAPVYLDALHHDTAHQIVF